MEVVAAERIAEAALPEPRILKPVEVPLKSEQAAHDVATRFALCRAISRSGGFPAAGGPTEMRVVSFFGSFSSAIYRNDY